MDSLYERYHRIAFWLKLIWLLVAIFFSTGCVITTLAYWRQLTVIHLDAEKIKPYFALMITAWVLFGCILIGFGCSLGARCHAYQIESHRYVVYSTYQRHLVFKDDELIHQDLFIVRKFPLKTSTDHFILFKCGPFGKIKVTFDGEIVKPLYK